MRFREAWIVSYFTRHACRLVFLPGLVLHWVYLHFPSSGLRPCGALEVISALVRVCRLSERKLSWQVLMILRSLAVMAV